MPGGTSPVQKLNSQLMDLLASHFWRRKEGGVWRYLQTPLTSGSWDGDARSTTAKTLIDLSAVFGVPAGVKAVLINTWVRDAGSSGGDYWVIFAPNDAANQGMVSACPRSGNDHVGYDTHTVPCDANGDIYYQVNASGAGTLDLWVLIWGYCL